MPTDAMNRMPGVPSGQDDNWHVIVQIENEHYALPAINTLEMLQHNADEWARVPHSPPQVIGVMNHRGVLMPVVDLRMVLGMGASPASGEIAALRQLAEQCEQDHVLWFEELRECVATSAEFTGATDPTKCAFGSWYEDLKASEEAMHGLTGGDRVLGMIMAQFDEPHRRIHAMAQRTLALAKNDKADEAIAIIKRAWDGELAEMKTLFARLLERFVELRQPILVIVDHTETRMALLVDTISSVQKIPAEATEAPPTMVSLSSCIGGVVPQKGQPPLLMLDLGTLTRESLGQDASAVAA